MPTTIPATQESPLGQALAKRKHHASAADNEVSTKRQRFADDIPNPSFPSLEPYGPLLAQLGSKYQVKPLSVISSTRICKHIDKALEHLGRFSFLDDSVLPGVIFLHGKSKSASKAITIAETIRRRIADAEQKWYQYNVLYEITSPDPLAENFVVRDTQIEEEYEVQETRDGKQTRARPSGSTLFEAAVEPAMARSQAILAIFLSRVPVCELAVMSQVGFQTNEQEVDKKKRELMGLR